MRGHDEQQESMYSYISPEKRVPSDHPLRRLRRMVDTALKEMSPQFAEMYSRYGRPSIAPEKLLRALLLQVLYSVRTERQLMEQLGYNLLFRWFVEMIGERKGGRRVTMGGDKGYDVQEFVADVRDLGVTPHVAQNNRNRRSAVDERTTRHAGYEISQRKRKRVEEVFGWLKTIGLMRQTRHRGRERVSWMFTFAAAVYNLVRIRNLMAEAA